MIPMVCCLLFYHKCHYKKGIGYRSIQCSQYQYYNWDRLCYIDYLTNLHFYTQVKQQARDSFSLVGLYIIHYDIF